VAHSCFQFLGYRTERLFEDRNDPLFLRVASHYGVTGSMR
jgi:hypothetical protein